MHFVLPPPPPPPPSPSYQHRQSTQTCTLHPPKHKHKHMNKQAAARYFKCSSESHQPKIDRTTKESNQTQANTYSLLTTLNEFTIANVKFIRKQLRARIEIASLWRFPIWSRTYGIWMHSATTQWEIHFLDLIFFCKRILWWICEHRVFWEQQQQQHSKALPIASEFKLNYYAQINQCLCLVWILFYSLAQLKMVFSSVFYILNVRSDKKRCHFKEDDGAYSIKSRLLIKNEIGVFFLVFVFAFGVERGGPAKFMSVFQWSETESSFFIRLKRIIFSYFFCLLVNLLSDFIHTRRQWFIQFTFWPHVKSLNSHTHWTVWIEMLVELLAELHWTFGQEIIFSMWNWNESFLKSSKLLFSQINLHKNECDEKIKKFF